MYSRGTVCFLHTLYGFISIVSSWQRVWEDRTPSELTAASLWPPPTHIHLLFTKAQFNTAIPFPYRTLKSAPFALIMFVFHPYLIPLGKYDAPCRAFVVLQPYLKVTSATRLQTFVNNLWRCLENDLSIQSNYVQTCSVWLVFGGNVSMFEAVVLWSALCTYGQTAQFVPNWMRTFLSLPNFSLSKTHTHKDRIYAVCVNVLSKHWPL